MGLLQQEKKEAKRYTLRIGYIRMYVDGFCEKVVMFRSYKESIFIMNQLKRESQATIRKSKVYFELTKY